MGISNRLPHGEGGLFATANGGRGARRNMESRESEAFCFYKEVKVSDASDK